MTAPAPRLPPRLLPWNATGAGLPAGGGATSDLAAGQGRASATSTGRRPAIWRDTPCPLAKAGLTSSTASPAVPRPHEAADMIGGTCPWRSFAAPPLPTARQLLLNICPLSHYRYAYGQEPAFTPVHYFGQAFHQACFYALRKADTRLPTSRPVLRLPGFPGASSRPSGSTTGILRHPQHAGPEDAEAWFPSRLRARVMAVAVPFSARLRMPTGRPRTGSSTSSSRAKAAAHRGHQTRLARQRPYWTCNCYLYAAQGIPRNITGFRGGHQAKTPAVERSAVRDPTVSPAWPRCCGWRKDRRPEPAQRSELRLRRLPVGLPAGLPRTFPATTT